MVGLPLLEVIGSTRFELFRAVSAARAEGIPGSTTPATAVQLMYRKRLMMHGWSHRDETPNLKPTSPLLVYRKLLMMIAAQSEVGGAFATVVLFARRSRV